MPDGVVNTRAHGGGQYIAQAGNVYIGTVRHNRHQYIVDGLPTWCAKVYTIVVARLRESLSMWCFFCVLYCKFTRTHFKYDNFHLSSHARERRFTVQRCCSGDSTMIMRCVCCVYGMLLCAICLGPPPYAVDTAHKHRGQPDRAIERASDPSDATPPHTILSLFLRLTRLLCNT